MGTAQLAVGSHMNRLSQLAVDSHMNGHSPVNCG